MTDIAELVKEARRRHWRLSGDAQQRLLNDLADALEALDRENQAQAQILTTLNKEKAALTPFTEWGTNNGRWTWPHNNEREARAVTRSFDLHKLVRRDGGVGPWVEVTT